MKIRKNLQAITLFKRLLTQFSGFSDARRNPQISVEDAVMSAFAVFKLKCPSLLEFDRHRKDEVKLQNIKSLFGIKLVPSDTQMRDILDPISYHHFFDVFKSLFSLLRREKVLQKFKYSIPGAGDFFLNPIDGTGQFYSSKVKCEYCLVKEMKSTLDKVRDEDAKLIYYHQMLGSGIVHPDSKLVIPMAPEPIIMQEGVGANDCELNAAKRYLHRLKDEHPGLRFLIGGDTLYSSIPILTLIKSFQWSFITSIKPSSHKHLFNQFEQANESIVIKEDFIGEKIKKRRRRTYRFCNALELKKSGGIVNLLDYEEVLLWEGKKGREEKRVHFSWVTDIELNDGNIYELMRAGRARWKDENEIFNTLKNQGYHLEHNYGHGKENLATNFAMLANLAFLIDQIEELCCSLYRAARDEMKTKYGLFNRIKEVIQIISFESWKDLLESIAYKVKYQRIDSS